mmetsp:Transcript_21365/g.50201  ORF Transcript_21365/g.50201 Transcript_21365/m.50201 type:complete len:202 (-) Transcript_21365:1080-1685(-)
MTKLLLLLFSGWPGAMAFCPSPSSLVTSPRQSTTLRVVEVGPSDDDVEPAEPGQMRISEIKSELDLRRVKYVDCFDRQSLEERLNDARSQGRADESIIDEFNKRNLEASVKGDTFEVSDDMIDKATAGDGTLPGGMPPEMLKSMMNDPDLVNMLRSPKMQEIMKIVMSEGQQSLEDRMKEDKDVYECVQRLNQIMGRLGQS